jgi:hypothetical protein
MCNIVLHDDSICEISSDDAPTAYSNVFEDLRAVENARIVPDGCSAANTTIRINVYPQTEGNTVFY